MPNRIFRFMCCACSPGVVFVGLVLLAVLTCSAWGEESAGRPYLVADIALSEEGSNPTDFVIAGDTLFFRATDASHGCELWKTDGTEAGTVLFKDIRPGIVSSGLELLCSINQFLFFIADDGVHGFEFWRTDGTQAGTVMLEDIRPGAGSANTFYSGARGGEDLSPVTVGDNFFFVADDGVHGNELWVSNTTTMRTYMVKDIAPGNEISLLCYLSAFKGVLLFWANDGVHGFELWRSDGTEAGTYLVKDICAGSKDSFPASVKLKEKGLFFTIDKDEKYEELWRSDGTEAGTCLVKKIRKKKSDLDWDLLVDFAPWEVDDGKPKPWSLAANSQIDFKDTLFLAKDDGVHGSELWRSDGTDAGTVMVKDINIATVGSGPYRLRVDGESLLFTADDGIHGRVLWGMDDAKSSPYIVKDACPGRAKPDVRKLSKRKTRKRKISKWEETPQIVKDITPGNNESSDLCNLINVNGTLFFIREGIHSDELWKSDGTEAGTVMLKKFVSNCYYPARDALLANVNGVLFFSNERVGNIYELWKSDGTEAGTCIVKSDFPESVISFPENLINLNGKLFFSVGGRDGRELWKSDGTEAGTVMFKCLGNIDSYDIKHSFVKHNNTLFFLCKRGTYDYEIWKSDGTEAGTVMLAEIPSDDHYFPIHSMTEFNDTLFFSRRSSVFGSELWACKSGYTHPPYVSSIRPEIRKSSEGASVKCIIGFSEPVANFDAENDFVITHAGTAHTGVIFADGPQCYTVTLTGITGSGSLTLSVNTGSDVRSQETEMTLGASTANATVRIDPR